MVVTSILSSFILKEEQTLGKERGDHGPYSLPQSKLFRRLGLSSLGVINAQPRSAWVSIDCYGLM